MPRPRALPLTALLAGVALLAAACSLPAPAGGGRSPDRVDLAPPSTAAPRAARRKPRPTWATDDPVEVVMNDRFRYRPAATGALTVPPGQTRRLTWTFDEPGTVLYGCHVLGHWAAGMKGTIVVVGG